jgi:hypothetical protein
VLLSTAVSAIRVAGWGIAAPHAREEAEALAVEHAGLRGGVPLVHPEAGEVEHAGLRLGPPLDGAAVAAEPRVAHGPTDPGVGWERITRVEPSGALAAAEATGALTAVARAVQMLREAEVQRVLISDASGDSLSLALILERSEPT